VYRTQRGSITALSDFNLDVKVGEFVSIIGPSGCGKSTLLKIAAGLLQPSSGKILLNGTPITQPRRDVGIVFQSPNLMPWKTVLANILIVAQSLKLDPVASRQRALDLLELVDIREFADDYPGELSGGMQQRVGLVRGLIHDPSVLLMDEPFAALDAMTRENMTLELQRLWLTSRKSVIFITHSIPEAVFLSDRVVVLSGRPGKVLDVVNIPFARPRDLDTMAIPEFAEICNNLRRYFSDRASQTVRT
jgi:NitT/TauT family transport system ATP-binding protein